MRARITKRQAGDIHLAQEEVAGTGMHFLLPVRIHLVAKVRGQALRVEVDPALGEEAEQAEERVPDGAKHGALLSGAAATAEGFQIPRGSAYRRRCGGGLLQHQSVTLSRSRAPECPGSR